MRIAEMMMTAAFNSRGRKASKPMRVGADLLPLDPAKRSPLPRIRTLNVVDEVDLFHTGSDKTHLLGRQTFDADGLTLKLGKNEDGERILEVFSGNGEKQTFLFTGDARLIKGKDGKMELVSGKDAFTGGVLRAQAEGDILLRENAKIVDTGEFSATVISLGQGPATYTSSGAKTTYLGNFTDSTITDTGGVASFFGYFDNSTITVFGRGDFDGSYTNSFIQGGRKGNTFVGVYRASEVRGDSEEDYFSGLFTKGSMLFGLDGDDKFNGVFDSSTLDCGKGRDIIGRDGTFAEDYSAMKIHVQATIANSTILGGEGNDVLRGIITNSQADLGEGHDSTSGVFVQSSVTTGSGDDNIAAFYASASTFSAGDGNDAVNLFTAVDSEVDAGKDKNEVKFGVSSGERVYMSAADGGRLYLNDMRFTENGLDSTAITFGGVYNNQVIHTDAEGEVKVITWVDGVQSIMEAVLQEASKERLAGELEQAHETAQYEPERNEAAGLRKMRYNAWFAAQAKRTPATQTDEEKAAEKAAEEAARKAEQEAAAKVAEMEALVKGKIEEGEAKQIPLTVRQYSNQPLGTEQKKQDQKDALEGIYAAWAKETDDAWILQKQQVIQETAQARAEEWDAAVAKSAKAATALEQEQAEKLLKRDNAINASFEGQNWDPARETEEFAVRLIQEGESAQEVAASSLGRNARWEQPKMGDKMFLNHMQKKLDYYLMWEHEERPDRQPEEGLKQ